MRGRALVIVLDSLGIGGAPDASKFHNFGANTLGNIIKKCANGEADIGRKGPLLIPNLVELGIFEALLNASGQWAHQNEISVKPNNIFASAVEYSQGKDTPSGHLELMGLTVDWDWHYFPKKTPAFPKEKIDQFLSKIGYAGIHGNCHASGTNIIQTCGELHLQTGFPICYTSADSVFQIAAHEKKIGLKRLYDICEVAGKIFHPLRVGRIIARPFLGDSSQNFFRTPNRKDFSMPIHKPTILNALIDMGIKIYSIGKINDIFPFLPFTKSIKASSDKGLLDATYQLLDNLDENSFVFVNLIEFDSLYGHRRDFAGYAKALEDFDKEIPKIIGMLKKEDMLIITADHGNDPTFTGTDHTREQVPVMIKLNRTNFYSEEQCGNRGVVKMVDISATIADFFELSDWPIGRSLIS